MALDVGFDRDEVNTKIDNVDLANGQQHVVVVTRVNKGRELRINVRFFPFLAKKMELKMLQRIHYENKMLRRIC